jgi:phage terminase large subunit-like protein
MIRLFGEGKQTTSVFSGANGAGKTYLMVNMLANVIWGKQNHWFDYPLFNHWQYPKRIRIGTEASNVRDSGVIDDAIHKWWPKGRYEGFKNGAPYNRVYVTDTGWIVEKMSYEQETKEWESNTLGLAVFDEPPPKDKFAASVSRLRAGGRIAVFMTPLVRAGWLIDELATSKDMGIVYADIEENCRAHGQRGTLQHGDIERMLANMDPEEIEARAHGKPMHLSNVILGKAFSRETHVIPEGKEIAIPGGSEFGIVVDPARGKPWAIGCFFIDPTGKIIFTDEYPEDDWLRCRETNLTIDDYAVILKRLAAGRRMDHLIIDRHFANSRDDYGTTLKRDLYERFNFDFRDSYNCEDEVDYGIQKVKDYLGGDRALGTWLKIAGKCRNIIRSLERWDRNERLEPNMKSPYKDHFDLVRYVCAGNLSIDTPRPAPVRRPVYAVGR